MDCFGSGYFYQCGGVHKLNFKLLGVCVSSLLYFESSKIVRMPSLQDRITKILEDERLIPADLARAAGVSPMAVSYWMDGTTKDIKFKYADPIAEKYGYSTRWIMTGKGQPKLEAKGKPEHSGIDREALMKILTEILAANAAEGLDWDVERICRLTVGLYSLYEMSGELPDVRQAIQLEALR